MSKRFELREVGQVEILTLSDNYNDLTTMDSNQMVTRAIPVKDMEVKGSILAEHGFSALVKTVSGEETHEIFFDFGLTDIAVPYNVKSLELDLSGIEAAVLSHGHMDHFGSIVSMIEAVPKKPLPLYVHPSAFKANRYQKVGDIRINCPPTDRAAWEKAGAQIVESPGPSLLAGGTVLFLGEIERLTDFEKGMPNAYCEAEGEERRDPVEDDTGIAINLHGKGLVVLSGCSHSGIVNTVAHARKVTGVDRVHMVMGGFHLTGPAFEPAIQPTIDGLKGFGPDYVVPTHCTGRKAIMAMEEAFGERFVLNMSGTRLTLR